MSEEYYATASTDRYQLLKDFSKENRREATDAEQILWEYLRAGRMGVKFRRQHAILDYIADFVCLSEMLVIEVDGGYHNIENQIKEDALRSDRLITANYRVLRYTNEQIINDIEYVLSDIKENLLSIENDE